MFLNKEYEMSKIICAPEENLISLKHTSSEVKHFSAYSNPGNLEKYGYFGYLSKKKDNIRNDIIKRGIVVTEEAWDFLTIALSVFAADRSINRRAHSPDGWTRQIELDIYLDNPTKWTEQKEKLEKTLRFLTGDFWDINFFQGERTRPKDVVSPITYSEDSVCLLSGGMDSLIGAIDLLEKGKNPIFVSHKVTANTSDQARFVQAIKPNAFHIQWNGNLRKQKESENEGSTRSRSIVFIAFAAIAACAIDNQNSPVDIIIPENGYISLNIPLNAARAGSLSTKTAHPLYLGGLQEIWDAVGISARLINPYKFKTKKEMLLQCLNKQQALKLVYDSTSCGRFGYYKRTHCGRCVPCLVRRAALNIGSKDKTNYHFANLNNMNISNSLANDTNAMAVAYKKYSKKGIESLIQGQLAFAGALEKEKYKKMLENAFDELGDLLKAHNLL